MTGSTPPTKCRPEWPEEAHKVYEPIRMIGQGGYGSVWKAKRRQEVKNKANARDDYVAIKTVKGSVNDMKSTPESKYAKREVDILSEISHPNIVRLIEAFEGNGSEDNASSCSSTKKDGLQSCIVLSFACGPTLEDLLNKGGALGVHFSQLISTQLLSAIAHLHGHAVIHRDIKPDNIIVAGASLSNRQCWSDNIDDATASKQGKWHITLIDFGFARALSLSELNADNEGNNDSHQMPSAQVSAEHVNEALVNTSIGSSRGRSANLDASRSRKCVRDLSALGNRHYAAPEILSGLHEDRRNDNNEPIKERKSQQKCVSNYSMVADAFSAGATMRYMLTGVPPDVNVEEFLAMQSSPVAAMANIVGKIARKALRKKGKEKKNDQARKIKKRFKRGDELPKDAAILVRALTHWDPRKRVTVRAARSYPWVQQEKNNTDEQNDSKISLSMSGGKMQQLHCVAESITTSTGNTIITPID